MQKTTTKVRNRRESKFLANRQKRFVNPLDFAKHYGGSLRMKCEKGAYYMGVFIGEDFYAQAWGLSFRHAYRKMLKDFKRKWHYREMLLKTVFAPKVSNQKIVA